MIDTARRDRQVLVMFGLLLACETARIPSSEAVLPATDERSAAGAAASLPSSGGAHPDSNRGLGGNTPGPAGSGASGMGGNDTGSGGTAGDGASGGSSGASGRDADPSSGDEVRYALWLGPAADGLWPTDLWRAELWPECRVDLPRCAPCTGACDR